MSMEHDAVEGGIHVFQFEITKVGGETRLFVERVFVPDDLELYVARDMALESVWARAHRLHPDAEWDFDSIEEIF